MKYQPIPKPGAHHKRMKPKTVQPTAEQRRYADFIRSKPCIVCGGESVVHHLMEGGRSHDRLIPLCPRHHNMGDLSVHMLGSERKFNRVHNVSCRREYERLRREWEAL